MASFAVSNSKHFVKISMTSSSNEEKWDFEHENNTIKYMND